MDVKAPLGTEDILPEQAAAWQRVEAAARALFARYGYGEIRTPIFEATRLFVRSIGETTDIVEKEMYTLGEGEDSLTLRPEATAPVVRAYLEHSLHKSRAFQKLYYIGPMFRHERPQAGRKRQFHQIGVEAIGATDPLLDAEVIALACHLLDELGIGGYRVRLNAIGTPASRGGYRDLIKAALSAQQDRLCPDCRRRLDRNVFRVLDCKNEGCIGLSRSLPSILDHLPQEERAHFDRVAEALRSAGVPFEADPFLVRGFDYYTGVVFEITHRALGAQDALCGGGRYDNLIADLGGPPLGAVGFAIGFERLLMALQAVAAPAAAPALDLYVVTMGAAARLAAFGCVTALRRAGLTADTDYEGRGLKAQMRTANKLGARFVVVLGDNELASGLLKLKHMASGAETEVSGVEAILHAIREHSGQGAGGVELNP
ncbi:MAG TPA: histidine--tRNA ligase [Planctomycetota bacterium]|nr:histidine--tRNA ligase [Planctomycetota bacterium]HRT97392.1 histidine--tRNA ligase [Planctomycetota bacterium]